MATREKPLEGISIQIGTPVGDGKCDIEYVSSLVGSVKVLESFGAVVDWARLPGCSDLPSARAKIVGNFARSEHTHLMMIDADMGWDVGDIVRLLLLKRDFIGGVGCKKTYKLEFALNNCDDSGEEKRHLNGRPVPGIRSPGRAGARSAAPNRSWPGIHRESDRSLPDPGTRRYRTR